MATPFAVHGDLAARWRPLSDEDEEATATTLLGTASRIVRAECPGIDSRLVAVEPATEPVLDPDLVLDTVCAMVKRAMLGGEKAGVSYEQETTGPFGRGTTFANPLGEVYLTKQERRRLGYGGVRAGSVAMADLDLYVEDE
jgi:hypothetical protein